MGRKAARRLLIDTLSVLSTLAEVPSATGTQLMVALDSDHERYRTCMDALCALGSAENIGTKDEPVWRATDSGKRFGDRVTSTLKSR